MGGGGVRAAVQRLGLLVGGEVGSSSRSNTNNKGDISGGEAPPPPNVPKPPPRLPNLSL